MSAHYEFSASLIKLDSIVNQISKAVAELNRLNMPKPFKVQLTPDQLELLRRETKHSLTWVEDEKCKGWTIHGCKIEVIERSDA